MNFHFFFKALRASWIRRFVNLDGKWRAGVNSLAAELCLPLNYLYEINCTDYELLNMQCSNSSQLFYVTTLCDFNTCKTVRQLDKMNAADVLREPLWCNTLFNYRGKCLYFKECIESGILYVKDILNASNKVIKDEDILQKIDKKQNLVSQMFMFKNSTVKTVLKMDFSIRPYIRMSKDTKILVGDKLFDIACFSCKFNYDILISNHKLLGNKMEDFYSNEFKIENRQATWKNIYLQKLINIRIGKLRDFNFKVLHGILPCGYLLSKWHSEIRKSCNICGQIETIKHMLFECTTVKAIWRKVSLAIKINIQWKHIVTGFF